MVEASPDNQLSEEYQLRFAGNEDYRLRVWRILCERFFNRYIQPQQEVLDLGAGWGEFINQIVAAKKYAMDRNPDTGNHLAAGVQFFHQDCTTTWPLKEHSLDVVFTSNFLEHLPGKPAIQQTLAEARRCLKPGGRLLCLGPNIRYVGGAYWDFWDHHVPLTDASLADILQLSGFEIEQSIARFLPYSMSTGRRAPVFLVSVYLRLPLLWRVFGKQFLLVARRAGA
ncbi:MAG: class I SAM-dependent methyltransferase [Halieaceae bacterium]|nr:class I SAM-dependent methyltransferase [Halieaceae bacterium]